MNYSLRAVKLTHQTAPVAIRELIYLPEATCKTLLQKFNDLLGIREALVFSTCNRTEVYYLDAKDQAEDIVKILLIEKGILDYQAYLPHFQVYNEEAEAVYQLFDVSMGLQSSVLGDLQIANQVKQAYAWANEAGMAQAFLHRLLHTIFHTNKRVQQETPYRDGAASVSYAAAELAGELTQVMAAPKALVIGLGEMGRDVARNLDPEAFAAIHVMNRTYARAEALAAEIGAVPVPMEQLPARIGDYDVVLSAVSVQTPFLTPELLAGKLSGTHFFIDLGMPRTIDPAIEALPQAVVYYIDDIHSRTERTLERRRMAIPEVRSIIRQEMEGFMEWRQQLVISPTIHRMKEALEEIRRNELAKFLKNASEEESELIESITRSMMNKIIKMPVLQLKEACKRGEQENLIDLINDLFDLERGQKRVDKETGKK